MAKSPESTHSSSQQGSSNSEHEHDPEWAPVARPHEPRQRRSVSSSDGSSSRHSTANQESKGADDNNNDNDNEEDQEEEEDEYEKRIERTGCAAENEALQNCYSETHDWRACKDAMNAFRECWKRNGNVEAE
ncbi:hypothetical protein BGZ94_007234 [Podila epigama]|nr:hypothetical protein BGZ94_007234 [Podila epigama]